jgi:AcrR family transcriptional regulator
VRNQAAILAAAERLFAARGIDAPLDEIAREAGVGPATLYRHFPGRTELLHAIYLAIVERLHGALARAREERDPWDEVATFIELATRVALATPSYLDVARRLAQEGGDLAVAGTLIEPVREMVDRAHAAGVLREGVTGTDITLLPQLLRGVGTEDVWRRQLVFVLRGIRAPGLPDLPDALPPIDVARQAAIVHDQNGAASRG